MHALILKQFFDRAAQDIGDLLFLFGVRLDPTMDNGAQPALMHAHRLGKIVLETELFQNF
jgi:hypothetical protein